MKQFPIDMPDWADGMNCAITVCDANCTIIYQNERARQTYLSHGNLVGKNLLDCHPKRAKAIIGDLLASGGTNAYTIEKQGLHKLIYQTAWKDTNGIVMGIVEISMILNPPLPHYIRR